MAEKAVAPGIDLRSTRALNRSHQLSGLGYPGFAHLRARKANPAAVVLAALLRADMEARLAEALPWVSPGLSAPMECHHTTF
jgi:hypothetical protein